jgi:RNA polymerase sigma-70 factor (ECF subfamily)
MNTAFLKVLTKINNYSGKGSFEGWVKKILVNTAIDYIRSDKKYKEQIMLDERIEEKNFFIEEEEFNEISIDEIYKMINKLPLMSRTVFNLYVIEGYKHMEIGEELQISEGTSKWHLSFARQKLRELINIREKQKNK